MKNGAKIPALFIAVAISLLSCSRDPQQGTDIDTGQQAPTIKASVGGSISTTKATDTGWEPGDRIGITMLYKDNRQIVGDNFNFLYVTNGSGGEFTPGVQEKAIYFPQEGSLVTFLAYYPFTAGLTRDMKIPLSVASQANLSRIDFMTAVHQGGESKSDRNIILRFHHKLSKLIFNLSQPVGQPAIDLSKVTMKVKGSKTTGSYDLFSETLTVNDASVAELQVPRLAVNNDWEAIVMPRQAGAGIEFEFTDAEGGIYTAIMSPSLQLISGYKYIFNITLSKTPIEVSAQIADWITGEEVDMSTIISGSPADPNLNIQDNDQMQVFTNAAPGRPLLGTYTYVAGTDSWSGGPFNWDDLQDPTIFYASLLRNSAPAGSNQQDEQFIAEAISVNKGQPINFRLSFPVAKTIVELESSDNSFDGSELAQMTATLPDYIYGGQFDNGVYVNGTNRGTITPTTANGQTYAIIQPQQVPAGSTVVRITTGSGAVYNLTSQSVTQYIAGETTMLKVDMRRTPSVFSANVTGWVDGTTVEMGTGLAAIPADPNVNILPTDQLELYTDQTASRPLYGTYTYNGTTQQWSGSPIYWDNLTDPTTFYASILRNAAPANTNQQPERLVADPLSVRKAGAINLKLSYPVAKAVIKLKSTDRSFSTDELAQMRVTLPGYIFDGYFQNGLFVSGTQPGTITPTNVGGTMYAIIQPQQIAAGNTVVRVTTSSNNVYDLTYNANVEFIAGITTILEVDMKQTPGMLSANVTDWVTGNTIPFTPTPITVSGTLNNTSDFFRGKTIHIYKYGATNAEFETFTYSYLRNTDGTGYSWNGRQLYWDNYVGQTLNVTSIYYTMQSMIPPAVDATTISFPWNLPANQSGGYSNYDILSTKMGLLQPTMINFNFIHPLSKVRVEIKSDEFTSAELAGASVILNNIVLTGIINLPSGTASPSGTPAATIVPQTDAEGSKYSALVMPSTVAAGTTIVTVRLVEYPNVAFTGSLSTDLTFVAGKEHLLTVTLRRTEAQLSATYEEWTDGDSGEITIE